MNQVRKVRGGRTIVRLAAFLIVFCLIFIEILHIIIPKFYRDNTLPPSSSYSEFYRLNKNTADVLFLGSSHCFASFNTQELYNRYGITSFNLGCGNQNLLVSYYWLREALRSQSPRAVVLDCAYLFLFNPTTIPNFVESRIRMALTYMRWSPVKWEAVRDVCRIDDSQSVSSYVFPMIRFHDRWEELADEDFKYGEITGTDHLKGSCEAYLKQSHYDYTPFSEGDGDGATQLLDLQVQYLDKITSLCKDNGIELVLTLTPYAGDRVERHNAVKAYADENGLSFINFGEASVYSAMGYNFSEDNADHDHPNPRGSAKVTDYLGKFLTEKYGLGNHEDVQWERSKNYYQTFLDMAELVQADSAGDYISGITNTRLVAFVYAKGADSSNTSDDVKDTLNELGLADMLSEDDSIHAAVIDGGEVLMTCSDLKEETDSGFARGLLKNGTDQYALTLTNDDGTYTGGFSINNIDSNLSNGDNTIEYNRQLEDGVTVILYDKIMMREVDKVHLAGEGVER